MTQAIETQEADFAPVKDAANTIPWRYLAAAEHQAELRDATGNLVQAQSYGTEFSVTPDADTAANSGTMTLLIEPPATATVLTLRGETVATSNWTPPAGQEQPGAAFDRLALVAQQLTRELANTLRVRAGGTIVEGNEGDMLTFDASGKLIPTVGPLTGITASAAAAQVLDDPTFTDMLTTLGFSTFFKTLIGVATASGVLGNLGVSAFIETLFDDADDVEARATLGLVLTSVADFRAATVDRVLEAKTYWDAKTEVALVESGGNVAVDMATGETFKLDPITGNPNFTNPTNVKVGQRGHFRIVQDGTGGWVPTFSANYYQGGLTKLVVDTSPAAETVVYYYTATATRIELSSTPGIVDYVDRLTAGADAVGAIAFLGVAQAANLGRNIAFGSTLAGSRLFPATVFGTFSINNNQQVVNTSGSAMTGTWRCLGWLQDPGGTAGEDAATLWTRTV